MEKRIKAPYYTERPTTLAGFLHGKTLPNGWLYSRGMYRTKITAEDLPEHYIRGTIYKAQGYISVLGIKNIVYRPNYHINHMHRDDFLYVSYDKPIRKTVDERGFTDYWDYDALMYGGMILTFIRAIRKYKSYNIEPIAEEVKKKEKFFLEKYPEECKYMSKSCLLE